MRIPYDVTFHPSWWNSAIGTDFSQGFFDDPEYRMDEDVKMRRHLYERFGEFGLGEKAPERRPILGTDLLAAGYLHSEIAGCEIVYSSNDSPRVVCPGISSDDVRDIEIPDIKNSPVFKKTEKQIEYLLTKYGRVEPCVNLMGVQNIALDLMGEEFYYAVADDAEGALGLLEKLTQLSIDIGRRFYALSDDISGGVSAIVRKTRPTSYLTSNCTVEMVSLEHYEKYLLGFDQMLANAFPDFGIHHCGRSMEHVSSGYAKVKNLTFAEVGAGSDIKKVREALPNVFLNARYSPVTLSGDTNDVIEATVDKLFRDGWREGLYSISCVGIGSDVPDDRIRALLLAFQRERGEDRSSL